MTTKIKPGLKVECSLFPGEISTIESYNPDTGNMIIICSGQKAETHISKCKAAPEYEESEPEIFEAFGTKLVLINSPEELPPCKGCFFYNTPGEICQGLKIKSCVQKDKPSKVYKEIK